MKIQDILSKEEIKRYETDICNARCDLEELADRLYEADAEILGNDSYEIQDIANQLAELENYLWRIIYHE